MDDDLVRLESLVKSTVAEALKVMHTFSKENPLDSKANFVLHFLLRRGLPAKRDPLTGDIFVELNDETGIVAFRASAD